jgi:D-lactate dehydrogenase (cytochrome)
LAKIFLRALRIFMVKYSHMNILDLSEEYMDYLHDESRREGHAGKICFPTAGNEVVQALEIARENNWSVTVQGGRTGITGGCVPEGGLILNLSRMNTIGKIEGDRLTVQPCALLAAIRESLSGSDLFFPSDLTETTASIGGMVATNASGARSFKYGAVREWVQALEVLLPNGVTVRVERGIHKADGLDFALGGIQGALPLVGMPEGIKCSAGYLIRPDMDLVDLFIGAEGTLGVVTEVTLKLLPRPEQEYGLTAFFASEEEALPFVRYLREKSRPVAIEFFDFQALELLRRMRAENPAFAELPGLDPEFHTAIYFEFDCEIPDAVADEAGRALDCWFAEGEREIEALKKFRHAIPEAVNMLIGERKKSIPELTKLGTDMSVPDDHLGNVMRMYHEGLADAGLEYVIFGHIGNNHVHVNILPRSMAEYERGKALYFDWARQVVAMGGSVSAEHGIGKIKTGFMELMVGAKGIAQMRSLKELFDPTGMLNPGNLFSA